MKKRSFKFLLPLLLCAASAAMLACGCAANKQSATPSARPSTAPNATQGTAMPTAGAAVGITPGVTADVTAGADASAHPSQKADSITGFMEGGIVDPEDVPELIALLKNSTEYADMTVQSVTYKLFEGRQAYYVVLQGNGEASHPIYVFADDSIISAEMNGD